MNALKWLWDYVKKYRSGLITVFFITLVFIACTFINPIILGRFVDDVIRGGKTNLLLFYSLVLIGAVVIKELFNYIRQAILEKISQNVVKAIRNTLYAKLQSLDCNYFDHTRTGDLMSRLTMDTDAIRMLIASTAPTLLNQLFFIAVGFLIIFSVSPIMMLALFSTLPFVGLSAYLLSKHIHESFIIRRESNAKLNTIVQENISGNRVVKAYAKEDYEEEKFEKCNQNYMDTFMDYVDEWKKYGPMLHFFVLLTNAVFILAGGIFLIKHIITVGQFTTISGCLWCIISPMASIGNIINQYQQFSASCLKIRKLEDEKPLIQDRNVKKRSTGINGKIQFKNVTFSYDGDRVLKYINFTAEAGQTIAIIGPTGSGKSTIINLLSRFYDPTYGTIYLDDVNIRNIELKTIHKNISYAMQDVFLFSDTVRNNIAYGVPDATDEDVIRVAKAADAHDFICKMIDGYDTVVGERGVGLSGGQRQRISLARALLKNPSILVLDDTTSALDMETEFSIQETLKYKYNTKTKIIIAHRISTVKNADLILVLNQGNLIEWGNHETLMSLNGYYKGVFDHQFGDFDQAPRYHIAHPAAESFAQMGGVQHGTKQN